MLKIKINVTEIFTVDVEHEVEIDVTEEELELIKSGDFVTIENETLADAIGNERSYEVQRDEHDYSYIVNRIVKD